MTHPTILLCMGTRPEIIKMVPVVVALRARGADVQILHTGQHTSMADPLYDFFAMRPQHVLLLERQKNDLAELSAQLIERIAPVLQQVKPAAVLVHGDTSSALMAALAAFYEKIPIGHVEAGLRTHAKYDPFPEEKNRELIGRLAHWHFCPTPRAAHNLQTEGLTERIIVTGNTVIDAALQTIKKHSAADGWAVCRSRRPAPAVADRSRWGQSLPHGFGHGPPPGELGSADRCNRAIHAELAGAGRVAPSRLASPCEPCGWWRGAAHAGRCIAGIGAKVSLSAAGRISGTGLAAQPGMVGGDGFRRYSGRGDRIHDACAGIARDDRTSGDSRMRAG
jgi:hypothetical protein